MIARGRRITQEDFEAQKLSDTPARWAADDAKKLAKIIAEEGYLLGNTWLKSRENNALVARGLMEQSNEQLADIAEKMAKFCDEINLSRKAKDVAVVRCFELLKSWHVQQPSEALSDAAKLARMVSPVWWLHGLRKAQKRLLEQDARKRGYVHRRAGLYVSDEALALRRAARRRCEEVLQGFELVSKDSGTVLSMADVAASGMANPDNRRAELMTRIRGFEEFAKSRGDVCEFVTLTAPSKHHERTSKGNKNPKYDKEITPRHTQAYLCELWSRVRAALARAGIIYYGLRIAEPHHDGTPHWHLALFLPASSVERFRAIFAGYALAEDGQEAGAAENRIKFVAINPAKGSAAGYVLKYVCKNLGGIDDERGGADFEGGGHTTVTAERVEAWASTWGIRQFQSVGGHFVGVWRELRRVSELDGSESEVIQAAWCAANPQGEEGQADFAAYLVAMGGVERKARDALVGLVVDWEEREGLYGLESYPKVLGLESFSYGDRCFVESEREAWVIRRKPR